MPGTESIIGSDQCWSGIINWIVSSPSLILKYVQKFKLEPTNGNLVVWAHWTSIIKG